MSKATKKLRKLKLENEKKVSEIVDEELAKLDGVSNEDIFNFSEAILKKKVLDEEDNIKLKAYKKHVSKSKEEPLIDTYPSIKDPSFNRKLFNKKEFLIDKIPPLDNSLTIDELTKKLCKFKLSPNQKFLKKYLSENTNYNGLLLYHGTGVGKTCSSISIAEQFMDRLTKLDKKVIILLNPSIKANFMKNIFNIEKLKQGMPRDQCTRDKYMNLLNIDINNLKTQEDYNRVNNRIKKLIKNKYSFYGYREFANMIEKLENISTPGLNESMKNRIIQKKIQKMFSHSVMIIDEVHNIKENSGSKEMKVLPPIIKRVLTNAINMKLVLLSATPMYDNATEIIFLLNLLLMNDKRDTIEVKDIFKKNGSLKKGGREKLKEISRGYISYLRGEHPIKFPKKLYPDIYNDSLLIKKFPIKDVNDTDIEPINNLKIIGCVMKDHQLKNYKKLEFKSDDQSFGPFNLAGMMASNIVYPSKDDVSVNNITSKKGFDTIFKKDGKLYDFKSDEYKNMFEPEQLNMYSAKLAQILKNIKNSEGIIFIYSQFIYAGILPLALALENNGYNNFTGNLMKSTPESSQKYLLITGDNELSSRAYEKYLAIENENMNGEKVKIIIGSESAAEGLDFKYIREVHILDPWHHLNKLDQVVGRAIRNCSHISLPLEKRNVLVYYYASIKSKNPHEETETIDLKLYRVAEEKSKKMAYVTNILRKNAVDCNLNKEDNIYNNELYTNPIDIITSRGTKHNVTLNDVDKSRECLYLDCDYKCYGEEFMKNKKMDTSTYDFNIMGDYYYDILDMLRDIFKKNKIINIENIQKEFLKLYQDEYLDLLYNSIDLIVKNDEYIHGKYVLRKKDNLYYKIHENKKNVPLNFHNLRINTKKQKRALNITKASFEDKLRVYKSKKVDNIGKIKSKLKEIYDNQIFIIDNDTYVKNNEDKKNSMKNLLNKYEDEYCFDYSADKKSIILHALKTNEAKYISMVDKNLLYVARDINPSHTDKKEIYGYKLLENGVINYYDKDNNLASDSIKRSIERTLFDRLENENVPDKLIGYLEEKKGSIVLKIRDKLKEGKKGTQIKTGSICGNEGMKKGKIIEFMEYLKSTPNIYGTERNKLPGKPTLCLDVELTLRQYEAELKDNHRWFYNIEETFERELYKKK